MTDVRYGAGPGRQIWPPPLLQRAGPHSFAGPPFISGAPQLFRGIVRGPGFNFRVVEFIATGVCLLLAYAGSNKCAPRAIEINWL